MAVCALGAQATIAYFSIKPPEATLGRQKLYHPRIASRQVGFSQYTEPQLPWLTFLGALGYAGRILLMRDRVAHEDLVSSVSETQTMLPVSTWG